MDLHLSATQNYVSISLILGQYPILAGRIRARMRRELFERGVIEPQVFDAEVREKAILSQHREGLTNPSEEEPVDTWEMRMDLVRDQLTDLYFSRHLP
ncbi:MAG TPA: hypothetical protein VHO48_01495, partial [Anaerolineaceae bacterium]|nr:hypothetical protein [Anaerolineaceae bacterium]